MADDGVVVTIASLPFEMVETIMGWCTLRTVRDFAIALPHLGARIYESPLWQKKLCAEWPDLEELKRRKLDWYQLYKDMKETHIFCQGIVRDMPRRYYWADKVLPERDMLPFMRKCDDYGGMGYLYIVIFLKKICTPQLYYPDDEPVTDRLNMTHQYYARMVLDLLTQERLHRKYATLFNPRNDTPPETVLSYFNQWIEPLYGNPENFIRSEIQRLVRLVEKALPTDHPLLQIEPIVRQKWPKELLKDNFYDAKTCKDLIAIARNIMINEGFISSVDPDVTSFLSCSNDGKTLSNYVLSPIYFENVLRCCGIRCDLFYFSNHYLLIWRENWTTNTPIFLLNPLNGNLSLSESRCPYIDRPSTRTYSYEPFKLLVSLATCFRNLVEFRKRHKKNVVELIYTLHPTDFQNLMILNEINGELKRESNTSPMVSRILSDPQIENNTAWFEANVASNTTVVDDYTRRQRQIKYRTKSLKFAVGMICYHKLYHYACVIRGWDLLCTANDEWKTAMGVARLRFGDKQPFYQVLASDFTTRYVAEENLIVIDSPQRLLDIEEILPVDFSHFNGYFYVPNLEKEEEYPHDGAIRAKYKEKFV